MGSCDSGIVQKVEAILAEAKQLKNDDLPARLGLMKQIENLYQDLEPPINLFFKQWISLTVFTCVDIASKLGIFEKMKEKDEISALGLSKLVHVESGVIARVMRILVAARIIKSTGDDIYSHTAKSLIYARGENTAVDSFDLLTLLNRSYIILPEYLKTRSADDLLDIHKTPYACAYGMEGKTFYETLSAHPGHLDTFNRSMSEPGPDYGIFPFASLRKEVEEEQDRVFVVDIGGGKGQALRYIMKETDDGFGTRSKFVLQERPDVLEQLSFEQKAGIDLVSYDFHTEQPIKGAHVYYLCQILHNYPDHVCQDIIKHVAEAMTPKSRLLIVDAILPNQTDTGGDMAGYLIDFVGLAMGGKERTERQLVGLLEAEGLELVKVWPSRMSWQAVAEVRLKALED